jgi:hypothetical protein
MSDMENKLIEMRNGFAAVSAAVEAISKQPAPKAEILDRQLSGNKINGGVITNFASTGIKDTATAPTLLVGNDGVTVTVLRVNTIVNPLTIEGSLTVKGEITATKLHVDEISADVRNERTGPLEFKAEGGNIYSKGLIWTGAGNTRQLTMQGSPDRLFSSETIDISKGKEYRIANQTVISEDSIGLGIVNSNLQRVGTLDSLRVAGALTVDEHIFYDADSMRLGLGISEPNGAFSIASLDHEFLIDATDDYRFKIGTWTTSGLDIVTDDTKRISIEPSGDVIFASKAVFNGKIGVGVKNFASDADITTAGPIRMQGKKFEVGTGTPTSGSYALGDVVWNSSPKPTGYVGWVCIREGTPGEWKPFGQISS